MFESQEPPTSLKEILKQSFHPKLEMFQESLRNHIGPCSGTYGMGYRAVQPLLVGGRNKADHHITTADHLGSEFFILKIQSEEVMIAETCRGMRCGYGSWKLEILS